MAKRFEAILIKRAVPCGGINGSRRRWTPVAYTVERIGDRTRKVREFLRIGTDGETLLAEASAWADELNRRAA